MFRAFQIGQHQIDVAGLGSAMNFRDETAGVRAVTLMLGPSS
jgi:hypothetical protein